MNIANIEVSGVRALTRDHAIIPAGIVGATVNFTFTDPRWEELTKIAVFQGCTVRDAVMGDGPVVIPHETVAQPGCLLRVGVYGVDADRNLVIPTLWATVGMVRDGTDPSGDESVDPTLPVWAQLAQRVDEMETLVSQAGILSNAAKKCLLAILREGLYASDPSANIQRLEALLEITPAEAGNTAALGAARLGLLGLGIPYQI